MSSCRVYIGRLSYDAKEKDVERFFRGLGRIRDINLKNGFGFVVSVHSRHFGSSFALSCRSLTALEMLTTPCTSATDKRCWERGEGDGHTHTHARTHARTHAHTVTYHTHTHLIHRIIVEHARGSSAGYGGRGQHSGRGFDRDRGRFGGR